MEIEILLGYFINVLNCVSLFILLLAQLYLMTMSDQDRYDLNNKMGNMWNNYFPSKDKVMMDNVKEKDKNDKDKLN